MRKVLKNYEIEQLVKVITDPNSFFRNTAVKLPAAFRQAMRINEKTLLSRSQVYSEGQREIINRHRDEGHIITSSNGETTYMPGYKDVVINELAELAVVDNELELEMIPKEVANQVLALDLSMVEEDFIELFIS